MNNDKAKNNKYNPKEELIKEEATPEIPEEAQQEISDVFRDKYIRACADFSNARKRWDREKEDILKFSNSSLIRDLLIVLDESEQALRMVKEHGNIEEIIKGLEMAHNNFLNILKKQGLEPMESVGKNFDPHLHEVIASKEVDENIDKPVVLEEIQKGYILEDKVLRPARVIVGIHKQSEDQKIEDKSNNEGKNNKI
ncbi:MAG: nucleotide exchange factor GrpE [Candidatus Omnitrophota bacterium]